jgi:hypothetical protein
MATQIVWRLLTSLKKEEITAAQEAEYAGQKQYQSERS